MRSDNSRGTGAADEGRSPLWADLARAETLEEYGKSWLALQSSLIPSALQSLLIIREEKSDAFIPLARWPEGGPRDPERLADISERALDQHYGLLTELVADEATEKGPGRKKKDLRYWAVAYPLLIDSRLYGVVAVEISTNREDEIRSAMEQLQWGIPSLELFFRRRRIKDDEAVVSRLKSSVDLLASVLAEESFDEACMTFVTGIATRLHCDRVSLGFIKKNSIYVQAISHSAHFDKRMNFIRSLSMVMDEAILQGSEIVYPSPPGAAPLITRNHNELADQYGVKAILTIPLYGNERYYGALTLERAAEEPFSTDEVNVCRSVFALAAPALEGKRIQNLPLVHQVYGSAQRNVKHLLGEGYAGRKLIALLIVAVIAFFAFAKGEYRVTANATLEGSVRRTIAAPFRGYIRQAHARHGDTVQEGKLLCSLDDRDLRLEKTNLLGQQNQLLRQHQEAVALHDRAKANVIKAQLDQSIAQLDLTEIKLQRINIRAPFDGVLLSGDLSQKLGSVIEQGEVLFEIAPLTGYRLILQVNESEIAHVKEGQRGVLVLSALPDSFGFAVRKITPISAAIEGKNSFRVEANLDKVSGKFRPGMEGIGKISVDRRKLISIWTLKLRNWLRLWVWSWWP